MQDASGKLLHPTHEAFGDASHTASNITMIGDADPEQDACSNPTIDQVTMLGRNIGDLLNARNITWGWFEGGFNLQTVNANGSTGCARFTLPTQPHFPFSSTDYIPHHQPFQYYASTRNPTHARPSSIAAIGQTTIPNTHTPDPANHQYDSDDFFAALNAGNLAVGELPQGARVPGRPCRLLEPDRRAGLRREGGQRGAGEQVLEEHGHRHPV